MVQMAGASFMVAQRTVMASMRSTSRLMISPFTRSVKYIVKIIRNTDADGFEPRASAHATRNRPARELFPGRGGAPPQPAGRQPARAPARREPGPPPPRAHGQAGH